MNQNKNFLGYHITTDGIFNIAHHGISLPAVEDQVAAGCLIEGDPGSGLYHPIDRAWVDSWGDPAYAIAFDPTHHLVRGKLVAIG